MSRSAAEVRIAVAAVVVFLGAVGCSWSMGETGDAGSTSLASPPSVGPRPANAPTPEYAKDVRVACDAVAEAIEAGQLARASAMTRDPLVARSDPTCLAAATALIAERRASASALAEAARDAGGDDRVALATAARRMDDGNAEAAALLAQPTLVAPLPSPLFTEPSEVSSGTPSFPPVRSPAGSAPDAEDLCSSATSAIEEGRLAEARALIADVAEAETCVGAVTAALADHEAREPLTRAWRTLSQDRLSVLLLAAASFLVGAFAARAGFARRRAWGWLRNRVWPVASGLALALLLLEPGVRHVWSHPWVEDGLSTLATALVGGVCGFLLLGHLKAIAPTVIDVVDADGKSVENAKLGTLVASEVRAMVASPAAGVFAVKGGTDVNDEAVTAALDAVTQAFLKTVVTIWRGLTTGLGDRLSVNLVGTTDEPAASIVLRRGARVLLAERVDTREMRVDRTTPTDVETHSADRDLATVIAARVVLARLDVYPVVRHAPTEIDGLFGVTQPRSLALSTVAARRSEHGRYEDALELFARAHGIDTGNQAARFGRAVSTLRISASGPDALVALEDLEGLRVALRPAPAAGAEPVTDRNSLSWRCRYAVVIHRVNRVLTGGVPTDGHPSMKLLAAQQREVRSLVTDLEAVDAEGQTPHGNLVRRLLALARLVDLALDALTSEDVADVRSRLASQGPASVRGLVNAANGYTLLWARRGQRPRPDDADKAVELLRLAGLEVGVRDDIVSDPVLRLLVKRASYRSLLDQWDKAETAPYARLHAVGPARAALAFARYRTSAALLRALRDHPAAVSELTGATPVEIPWWTGAVAWLATGRDAALINEYQAAGIVDAAHAERIGDARVVSLLRARKVDDDSIVIPDARVRALMETTR